MYFRLTFQALLLAGKDDFVLNISLQLSYTTPFSGLVRTLSDMYVEAFGEIS